MPKYLPIKNSGLEISFEFEKLPDGIEIDEILNISYLHNLESQVDNFSDLIINGSKSEN